MRTTRAGLVVFGALVIATFAAFFVTQRLKRTPPAVQRVMLTPFFSPNHDGRFDAAHVAFRLKKTDDVTVTIEDHDGDPVRKLADDRQLHAYTQLSLTWDGRTAGGRPAPDGEYRVRVNLGRQGRSILLPRRTRLDTTPPRPVVLSIGPTRSTTPQPEILPEGADVTQPATIRIRTPSTRRATDVLVYRTDPSPAFVTKLPLKVGATKTTWDGTVNGRRVRPGTYAVALRTRDQAGNIGSSPSVLPPAPSYGAGLAGKGGITVRYLGVQPPLEPTVAESPVLFGVDARRRPYTWSIRRAGTSAVRKRGHGTRPIVRVAAPGGKSGLYLFTVRSGTHVTTVPFAVQSVTRRKVLVVLPALLWQGVNPVDDDGDGWPDTLTHGLAVRRARVFAQGLPTDLVARVAPLLIHLDRTKLRYDLTTDLALATGNGPPLGGHSGVLLAGDERWLPTATQAALRRFVAGGGRVANFGTDALLRGVRVTGRRLVDPTAATPADAFGATLRQAMAPKPVTVTVFHDPIKLFAGDVVGGTGELPGQRHLEVVERWPGTRELASATTPAGSKVVVAARLGRGVVVHLGLPDLMGQLDRPGNASALVRRIWTLLSH